MERLARDRGDWRSFVSGLLCSMRNGVDRLEIRSVQRYRLVRLSKHSDVKRITSFTVVADKIGLLGYSEDIKSKASSTIGVYNRKKLYPS